jgi:hypothetical protein
VGRLFKVLTLFLVFILTPGATELLENAAHLAVEGHGAHALDDAEHAPEGDEHGCSSTFHVCACHSSTCFVMREFKLAVTPPSALPEPITSRGADQQLLAGYELGVFRPPARALLVT